MTGGATHDEAAAIAYDCSIRALASQESQLSAIHTRASFVLGAAGIATGTVLGHGVSAVQGFGWVAVVAFGAAAALATVVIAPRREHWRFGVHGAAILDAHRARPAASRADLLDWLARVNERNFNRNRERLNDLYALLTAGCLALAVAVIATIIDFVSG